MRNRVFIEVTIKKCVYLCVGQGGKYEILLKGSLKWDFADNTEILTQPWNLRKSKYLKIHYTLRITNTQKAYLLWNMSDEYGIYYSYANEKSTKKIWDNIYNSTYLSNNSTYL